MIRLVSLAVTAITGLVLLYISRFWPFTWWDRPGLFGLRELPPGGGLLQRWLRGTELAPYELMIWFIAGLLILTLLQTIFGKIQKQ